MARLILSFPPRRIAVAAGFVVSSILSAPAGAQQLIPDGDFDGTLGSWSTNDSNVSLTLGMIDATGCAPDSVSARAETSAVVEATKEFDHECISGVVAGQTYSFGGLIRFSTGQKTTGFAEFGVNWFEDCVGGSNVLSGFSAAVVTDSAGTWVESRLVADAPPGATAAVPRFYLHKDQAGGTLVALFDRVFLTQGDLIFADDFEIHRTCRWSDAQP